MENSGSKREGARVSGRRLGEAFRALSQKISQYANRGLPRVDFAREVSRVLLDFSGCHALELRLKRKDKYYLFRARKGGEPWFHVEQLPCLQTTDGGMIPCSDRQSGMEALCREVVLGRTDSSSPLFTENGAFWSGDLIAARKDERFGGPESDGPDADLNSEFQSLAIFPLQVDSQIVGLLQLKSRWKNYFTQGEIEFYEGVAQTLGMALAHRTAQVGQRERIKELTCLYGIARLAAQPDISLKDVLQGIAQLIPPAWLYPDAASGKIIVDGSAYASSNFREGPHKQTADIEVGAVLRGRVEVSYSEEKPELDEGPFLREERSLIDAIAKEVGSIIERREAEEEKSRLQDQLRHADRLATIGQLAAGVAHELNEPLGNALGFCQLAKKSREISQQAKEDVEKAIIALLHAREVVKKLMLFARRMPPQKTQVNLNRLVEEGLYFLESRCAKEEIELKRVLAPDLPEIIADAGQLSQVLVNLVVNAVQAMPRGGTLTVQTSVGDGHISLVVEDTGAGMSQEVVKKIFIPFFTTKEVNEGTGLGLSVVHGIVTSHGGSIKVESKVDHGTRFEVRLPLTGAPDVEENGQDNTP